MKKNLRIYFIFYFIVHNTYAYQNVLYANDTKHMLTPPSITDIAQMLEGQGDINYYNELILYFTSFFSHNAKKFNKKAYIEALAQVVFNETLADYTDVERLGMDMVFAVCNAAGDNESIDVNLLRECVNSILIEFEVMGMLNISVYPYSTLDNPADSISIPRIKVAQQEEAFVFGEKYTSFIEQWEGSDHEVNYISVNGRLLKEPVGFPGFWLLRDTNTDKMPSHKRIRIMKSFALMLNAVDVIEDNRFEIIVHGAEMKTDDSERIVARNDNIVMTMGEDNIIKFYIAEAFSALSCIAQRRVCFDFFNSILELGQCLNQNKLWEEKENQKSSAMSLKKKKVVFLHMVDKNKKSLRFAVPSSYHLLAAELDRVGIEVEFQPVLQGAVPLKEIGKVCTPSLRLLTERDDIGLFVVLNVSETNFYDYRRMIKQLHKDSPAPIIAGGPFFTLSPEHAYTHLPYITASMRGEGEEVIVPITKTLLGKDRDAFLESKNSESLLRMNNIILHTADTTVCNNIHNRRMISSHDMDQLAIVETDFSYLRREDLQTFIHFCSGRGCPKKCPWCSRVGGSFYRAMSADSIITMLTHYRERLDQINEGLSQGQKLPEEFYSVAFVDDDFFLNKKRAKKILQNFHKTGLKIQVIMTSIGSLLNDKKGDEGKEPDYNLLDMLKDKRGVFSSGDPTLVIGTDSFIQKEIDRHKKGAFKADGTSGYTEDNIAQVVEACEKRGIRNDHYLILTNMDTSWGDFFNQLYRIAEIGKGKKYFQIFFKYITAFVMSHYPSDSYKNLAERGLAWRILTEVEPASPYYEELSYPITLLDEPLLLGPADMVSLLVEKFKEVYTEAEQKLRRMEDHPEDFMPHIMYETVYNLSNFLSTLVNMYPVIRDTAEMEEAHKQALSAERRFEELLGTERLKRISIVSSAPVIRVHAPRTTQTSH